jgi:hypothetical protein
MSLCPAFWFLLHLHKPRMGGHCRPDECRELALSAFQPGVAVTLGRRELKFLDLLSGKQRATTQSEPRFG